MRGRKPKPTEVKRLTGNPGKRPLTGGVASAGGDPDMPDFLCPEAQEEWRRVLEDARPLGLLGRENRAVLALYCQAWARMTVAERHINEHGSVVPAPRTGVPMQNPHVSIARSAGDRVAKMAVEMGLTPSSRSRVGAASHAGAPEFPVGTNAGSSGSAPRQSLDAFLASDPDGEAAAVN